MANRTTKNEKEELKKKIIELNERGATADYISEHLGVSKSYLYKVIRTGGELVSSNKNRMADLWQQWDYIHMKYGSKQ